MTCADARFTVDVPSGASALVVVGGWHGARDKNVKKYTDEFNKWGVATLRTIMPGHLTLSPVNSGRAAFTRDLLLSTRAARQTHGLADKPLYFMFMSNGGCWIWATIHVEGSLDGEFADLGRDLSGVIFDSSPAFMTVAGGAKVLSLGAHPAVALAVKAACYVAAGIIGAYSLLTTASLDAVPPKMFWRAVRQAKPRARAVPVQRRRRAVRRVARRGAHRRARRRRREDRVPAVARQQTLRASPGREGTVRGSPARVSSGLKVRYE